MTPEKSAAQKGRKRSGKYIPRGYQREPYKNLPKIDWEKIKQQTFKD